MIIFHYLRQQLRPSWDHAPTSSKTKGKGLSTLRITWEGTPTSVSQSAGFFLNNHPSLASGCLY